MSELVISTKIVRRKKMDHHTFLRDVKKTEPASENISGYHLKYPDGYESWVPQSEGDKYRLVTDTELSLIEEQHKK